MRSRRYRVSRGSGAKAYALRLLGYRARSRKEMYERLLRKGFSVEESEEAIMDLENAGLIDDTALVNALINDAVERRCLGKKGIRRLLASRGIDQETIDEAVSGLAEQAEEAAAMRLIEKRLRVLKDCPADVIRQRLWRMLERRGFSTHIISTALRSIDL